MKDEFLYKQLYDSIIERIESGEYPEGCRLPTEAEMEQDFQVSSITVKKALGMLAERGFVRRVPGRGTFVQKTSSTAENTEKDPADQNRIGVILEHIATPYGLSLLYEMDQAAEATGYKLCVRFSYGDREKEKEEIRFLISLSVQGLIVMPSHGRHYSPAILKLYLDQFPMVLIDKKLTGIPLPSVRTDNYNAVAQLVRYLAEQGCSRITFISADDNYATSLRERRSGYLDTMRQLKLAHRDILSFVDDRDFAHDILSEEIMSVVGTYLEKNGDHLDAVICSEYGLVPSVAKAAQAAGLLPDKDFRLCSIDEDYLSPYGYTFAHMKQDEHTIAKTAVELLLNRISGQKIQQEDHLIPAIFHDRSTGRE